jgi:thiosulfate reductase/polysulfide reductase chain A
VLIGSHLGENMHNSQVQEFAQAVERKVPVIVVDPRFSVAASKAKYWLPVKPGTDIALLLAWMNLLVTEGRYDKAYVEQYGHGFDKFKAEIKGYTPDWAAEETGVSAALIRAAGLEFASHRRHRHPPRPARQLVRRRHPAQPRHRAAERAAGQLRAPGRLFVSQGIKIAPYPLPKYPEHTKPRAPMVPKRVQYPFADEGITTSIRDATISGKPYPIKGWFVYSTNLMQALPNEEETIKAIQKLDLLVVCDTVPGEMAGWADVILPDTTFLERHDELLTGFGRNGWAALRQPVVARRTTRSRPGGSPSTGEKLGVGAACPSRTWRSTCLPRRKVRPQLGQAQEGRRDPGRAQAHHGGRRPGAEALTRPAARSSSGPINWRPRASTRCPSTPSTPKAPAGHFRLITGRAPGHTFSRTQTNPLLHDLMPENEIWVNASHRRPAGHQEPRLREAEEPGRRGQQPHPRQGHAAHPRRLRLHGLRLRPHQQDAQDGLPQGRQRGRLNTRYATDPIMGATSIHTNFVSFVKEA